MCQCDIATRGFEIRVCTKPPRVHDETTLGQRVGPVLVLVAAVAGGFDVPGRDEPRQSSMDILEQAVL